MNIALDLDGVVCGFVQSILRLVGKEEMYEKVHTYSFAPVNSKEEGEILTREDFYRVWDRFTSLHGFVGIQMVPGAFETINTLLEAHELFFITDRRDEDKNDTRNWLTLMGWSDKILLAFSDGDKVETLKRTHPEFFPDIFMDDKLEIVVAVKKAFPELCVCVFDRPWNQELGKKYKRIYNWDQFLKFVNVKTGESK